jgi:hypothetical protein
MLTKRGGHLNIPDKTAAMGDNPTMQKPLPTKAPAKLIINTYLG